MNKMTDPLAVLDAMEAAWTPPATTKRIATPEKKRLLAEAFLRLAWGGATSITVTELRDAAGLPDRANNHVATICGRGQGGADGIRLAWSKGTIPMSRANVVACLLAIGRDAWITAMDLDPADVAEWLTSLPA